MDASRHIVRPETASQVCDRLFSRFARPDSPGVAVAVTHRGKVIHQACYGMADMAHAAPLTPRSVIRIGSQTKQFTVLLALMLEAEGKLSMDDDVHRHLNWLPKFEAPITLGHLATNTSGMRDFLEALAYSGVPLAAPSTRDLARQVISRQTDLNFRPGDALIYCNTGFFLLADILEKVSGRSFDELLQERICGPLGMNDTRLMERDSDITPRLAAHHTRDENGRWTRAAWGFPLGGEGGMISTLDDMVRWQLNLAAPKVGSRELFQRMATPPAYANGATCPYAWGFVSGSYHGLRVVGHGGGVAGGRSESQRYPDADFGVVILGNLDEIAPYSLARRIADACLADSFAAQRRVSDLAPLAARAGLYRDVDGDDVFEIRVKDDEPALSGGMGAAAFDIIGENLFAPEYGASHLTLSLRADSDLDAAWCGRPRRYRRLDAAAARPQSIEGNYANCTLGMTAVLANEAGHGLALRTTSPFGVTVMSLTPIDHDLYLARPGPFAVGSSVNKDWLFTAKVSGDEIVLNNDRTKRLAFRRKD